MLYCAFAAGRVTKVTLFEKPGGVSKVSYFTLSAGGNKFSLCRDAGKWYQ